TPLLWVEGETSSRTSTQDPHMDIKRIGSQASAKGPADYFTGSVRVDPLLAGHKVGPDFAVYAASKFAVRVLADGLRQEVKPYNIRTTVISPGAVATELPNSVTERISPRASTSTTTSLRFLPNRSPKPSRS